MSLAHERFVSWLEGYMDAAERAEISTTAVGVIRAKIATLPEAWPSTPVIPPAGRVSRQFEARDGRGPG